MNWRERIERDPHAPHGKPAGDRMGYLMDTNIVSELRKETRCSPGVTRSFDAPDQDQSSSSSPSSSPWTENVAASNGSGLTRSSPWASSTSRYPFSVQR